MEQRVGDFEEVAVVDLMDRDAAALGVRAGGDHLGVRPRATRRLRPLERRLEPAVAPAQRSARRVGGWIGRWVLRAERRRERQHGDEGADMGEDRIWRGRSRFNVGICA